MLAADCSLPAEKKNSIIKAYYSEHLDCQLLTVV
jgi:hypothetical protein